MLARSLFIDFLKALLGTLVVKEPEPCMFAVEFLLLLTPDYVMTCLCLSMKSGAKLYKSSTSM